MKTITSLIVTVLVSACILFLSATIGQGPWYVQGYKWRDSVFSAAVGAVPAFLLIVWPASALLRRSRRELSRAWAFAIGAGIGIAVTALPVVIGRVSLNVSVLAAGAIAGGAGFLTYVRFRKTRFTSQLGSGVLTAAGGAFLWALATSLWQGTHGLGEVALLLAGAAYVTLISSWFVFPLGGLLGVWMPRLVERSQSWVCFIFGSILGALVGCAAVLIDLVPAALHAAGSGISGLQLELVQSSLLQTTLKNVVTIVPFTAVWVGLWAVKSSRRFSHEISAA